MAGRSEQPGNKKSGITGEIIAEQYILDRIDSPVGERFQTRSHHAGYVIPAPWYLNLLSAQTIINIAGFRKVTIGLVLFEIWNLVLFYFVTLYLLRALSVYAFSPWNLGLGIWVLGLYTGMIFITFFVTLRITTHVKLDCDPCNSLCVSGNLPCEPCPLLCEPCRHV
jgi:hypothetical protein